MEKIDEAIGYIKELMKDSEPEFELAVALRNDRFILDILTKHKKGELLKPNLGCATTRELLDEIRARIEVDGKLDYRTIDDK